MREESIVELPLNLKWVISSAFFTLKMKKTMSHVSFQRSKDMMDSEEMLEATDYKKCIPEARSLDEAFNVYQRIPGYIDRARQNGVLALYLVKQ